MPFDPSIHHRRSIRLKDFDYTQAGAYFVTICAINRACLFGQMSSVPATLIPTSVGEMVWAIWQGMPERYPGVELDEAVLMPNHLHGIIVLNQDGGTAYEVGKYLRLSDVVQRFKSVTTAKYRQDAVQREPKAYVGPLWQRNYYEHVIRNDIELTRIRRYVAENPGRWTEDEENPEWGAG